MSYPARAEGLGKYDREVFLLPNYCLHNTQRKKAPTHRNTDYDINTDRFRNDSVDTEVTTQCNQQIKFWSDDRNWQPARVVNSVFTQS